MKRHRTGREDANAPAWRAHSTAELSRWRLRIRASSAGRDGFLALLVASLLPAQPALALDVPRAAQRSLEFSGASCGSTDRATVALPRHARRARVRSPRRGEFLLDPDGFTVARVLESRLSRIGRRQRLLVRVRGAGEACTAPQEFPDGWATEPVSVRATYRVRRQVHVAAECRGSAVRPARIIIACGDGNLQLTALRWSSWGGRTAVGTGTALANTCEPSCAEGSFERIPARVRLSRPRFCERTGRYQYLARRASGRGLRGASTSFDYLC